MQDLLPSGPTVDPCKPRKRAVRTSCVRDTQAGRISVCQQRGWEDGDSSPLGAELLVGFLWFRTGRESLDNRKRQSLLLLYSVILLGDDVLLSAWAGRLPHIQTRSRRHISSARSVSITAPYFWSQLRWLIPAAFWAAGMQLDYRRKPCVVLSKQRSERPEIDPVPQWAAANCRDACVFTVTPFLEWGINYQLEEACGRG